jgi:alpha-1,6-mannosyltransferase
MKFCDITIAYNDKSGGIRTYIDAKRRFLQEHTPHEHLLIAPGETNSVERDGRCTTVRIAGPLLPSQGDYRFFLSPVGVREALWAHQPDVIELGSYYMEPWAAFSYRKHRRGAGLPCTIGGYFHTDVAEAYVASPLKAAAHSWLDDVSEALSHVAVKIADIAARGAEQYISYVFDNCDVALAASPAQAARLREYGVARVETVPMGVDIGTFHPGRRSAELRAGYGAGPDDLVLVYAGRLCTEKRVSVLLDAFARLPDDARASLWLIGDGPLREEVEAAAAAQPRVRLIPYRQDRADFARHLASADIYVTAGPHETFGLSVIEAQACGLPVVGVNAGALVERVPDGLGRLAPVDDADTMAKLVLEVAGERVAMGRQARQHVERYFSWRRCFERLLDCYGVDAPTRSARAEAREGAPLLAVG